MKPHLKVVDGQPVEVQAQRETPLEAARRRFGKKFAHEPGSEFKFTREGATVLNRWLESRKTK